MLCLVVLLGATLFLEQSNAFSTNRSSLLQSRFLIPSKTACKNWLGDLWEEVIEFSTYGPSERKILKERREKAAAEEMRKAGGDVSMDSFQQAQQKYASKTTTPTTPSDNNSPPNDENDSLSLGSFQAAVASKESTDRDIDFDGYKLRDLMVEKWGVPLDVEFQRGSGGGSVYCIVLPVAFGSNRCRHETEMDYLMHLQGVVEILQKYNNLDQFLFFLQTTKKTPKPGVESAPYLMQLDEQALQQIL